MTFAVILPWWVEALVFVLHACVLKRYHTILLPHVGRKIRICTWMHHVVVWTLLVLTRLFQPGLYFVTIASLAVIGTCKIYLSIFLVEKDVLDDYFLKRCSWAFSRSSAGLGTRLTYHRLLWDYEMVGTSGVHRTSPLLPSCSLSFEPLDPELCASLVLAYSSLS